MSFLHLHARSLWQTIKQSIRQWVKPDNYSPVLNAALDQRIPGQPSDQSHWNRRPATES